MKTFETRVPGQTVLAEVLPSVRCPIISLAAKLAMTAFLAVLIPVYLYTYGPTNFLWFCDIALILTVVGMWLESSVLISMCAVGILIPQGLWVIDFCVNLFGVHFLNLTSFMFDPQLSLFTRGLSLFHAWLPLLLIWLVFRLGYDTRALKAWTILAGVIMLACYRFVPPAGAHPADHNLPINVNYAYGLNEQQAQTWISPNLYVILWFGALWLVAFLPIHLLLRKLFTEPPPIENMKLRIRIF